MVNGVIAVAVLVGFGVVAGWLLYRVLRAAHGAPGHGVEGAGHGHNRLEKVVLSRLGRAIVFAVRHGVRVGPVVMLTVRGRVSGEPRSNPVDLLESGGGRWLVATHSAEANWVRNLRAAGEGSLAHGRRGLEFTAVEVPVEAAAAVLRDVLGPRLARAVGGVVLRQTMGLGRRPTAEQFAVAAGRHPVFELSVSGASDGVRIDGVRIDGLQAGELRGDELPVGPWLGSAARPATAPRLLIGLGLAVALAHGVLGAAGVMDVGQWSGGVLIGALIAGLGNHLRIFGRR